MLFSCRYYSGANAPLLSFLTGTDADIFKDRYSDELEQYPGSVTNRSERIENLRNLTTRADMQEFRMPFFYGMFAFEDAFISIDRYTRRIIDGMNQDAAYKLAVGYLCLITLYTSRDGISGQLICHIRNEHSNLNELKQWLNNPPGADGPSEIAMLSSSDYRNESVFRICHPVIARKILIEVYGQSVESNMILPSEQMTDSSPLETKQFADLCVNLIDSLASMAGNGQLPVYYDQVIEHMMIRREPEIETDSNHGTANRKGFSNLIMDVRAHLYQKQILKELVDKFPDNPYFHQHFGRLLITNRPLELEPPKGEFNMAIKLDPTNPSHYHARGNMYKRYCVEVMNVRYPIRNPNPRAVYLDCKEYADRALKDFEESLNLALQSNNVNFQLSYPYTSTLLLCYEIIDRLMLHFERMNQQSRDEFWNQDEEYVKWCRDLMSRASSCLDSAAAQYEAHERTNNHFSRAKAQIENISACAL